ncbi:MAG: hypothetical protein Kow009_03800 [Spirochaetales bacterium]
MRLFHIALKEFPLFMQFSPRGTYLGVCKPTWQSITLYDASTGEPLPYLQEGFGIVNFFLLSTSERTLLSYSPSSGILIYWNLREGTRKSSIQTIPDLKTIRVLSDRYAVGTDPNSVYLIDLVTGETVARTTYPGIVNIISDKEREELVILSSGSEGPTLSSWKYHIPAYSGDRGYLLLLQDKLHTLPPDTTQIALWGNRTLAGLSDGTLASYRPYDPFPQIEGKRIVEPISDLYVQDGRLIVTTRKDIWFFPSTSYETFPFDPSTVERLDNPFQRPFGIVTSKDNELLFYTKDTSSGGILAGYYPESLERIRTIQAFPLPLRDVWSSESGLYCLEKSGNIRRLQPGTFMEDFQIPAGDVQTILPLDEQTLLLGKNTIGPYGIPLMLLHLTTGETIPLQIPGVFITFKLAMQPGTKRVFVLALRQGEGGETETVLYVSEEDTLEHWRPIAVLRSEDLEVDLGFDPISGDLLTTLGNGLIRRWDGAYWESFQSNNNLASSIHTHGRWIFSINKDGTASLWDSRSGSWYGEILFLQEGGWIIIDKEGNILPSQGVDPGKYFK